jgi:hypothetical protein
MTVTLVTPVARLSYPHLIKARVAPGSTDAKFGCMLIFDMVEDELRQIHTAIVKAGAEKFGAKAEAQLKDGPLHYPLRRGSERPDDPNVDGKMFLSANSKERPELVDRDRSPVLHDIDSLFYPGAYVRGVIAFGGFDVQMKKGVGSYLNALQFVRHGPRIDGRKAASKLFDDGRDLGDEGDEGADGVGVDNPAPRRGGPASGARDVPW